MNNFWNPIELHPTTPTQIEILIYSPEYGVRMGKYYPESDHWTISGVTFLGGLSAESAIQFWAEIPEVPTNQSISPLPKS